MIPEYHSVVPETQQTWLQKILIKIEGLQYTGSDQLLQDIDLLLQGSKTIGAKQEPQCTTSLLSSPVNVLRILSRKRMMHPA